MGERGRKKKDEAMEVGRRVRMIGMDRRRKKREKRRKRERRGANDVGLKLSESPPSNERRREAERGAEAQGINS